jgi:preprotein translocase subunit SecG
MTAALLAFQVVPIVKAILMFLFVLSAIVLIAVILLQEGKGGGLAQAFGGAGAETFGVQAGSVNRFTAAVVSLFMLLAILYAAIPEPEPAAPSDVVRKVAPEAPPPETPPGEGSTGEAGEPGR